MIMKKFFLILAISITMIQLDISNLKASTTLLFEQNKGQYTNCEYASTRNKWSCFLNKNEILVCFSDSVNFKNSKESIEFIAKISPKMVDQNFDYQPMNAAKTRFNYYKGNKKIENVLNFSNIRIAINNKQIANINYDINSIPNIENLTKSDLSEYFEIEFIDYTPKQSDEENRLFQKFKAIVNNKFYSNAPLTKVEWSTFIGGNSDEAGSGIAIHDNGDIIIICGRTISNDFPKKNSPNNHRGDYDGFVSKFDKDGNLISSSFIGGSREDAIFNCLFDSDNTIWLCGQSSSDDFPITSNAHQIYNAGGTDDGVIMHFDNDGKMLYSTYIGSNAYDAFVSIAEDDFGNLWFAGRSFGNGLPVTNNAFQKNKSLAYDGIVVKIKNEQVQLCTYIGYSSDDCLERIAVNSKGEPIILGFSMSSDLWVNKTAFQSSLAGGRDAWIAKLNPDNGAPIWATYLGGINDEIGYNIDINDKDFIAISGYTSSKNFPVSDDALQKVFAGNRDYFVTYFNDDGDVFYSTFFGGSDYEGADDWYTHHGGIVCVEDKIIFGGTTLSNDLPVTKDAYQLKKKGSRDSFYGVINLNGKLEYCTYFGGSGDDWTRNIVLSKPNSIYACGFTNSSDFPIIGNSFQKNKSVAYDVFLIKFSEFVALNDTSKPVVTSTVSDCNSIVKILISDKHLKQVQIIKNNNCNYSTKNLSDTCVEVTFVALPNSSEFEYEIIAEDEYGNVQTIKNKIFRNSASLKFIPNSIDGKQFDFKALFVGKSICLPIRIINTSNTNTKIDSAFLSNNFIYSFPHSQLPIIIPANDTIDLYVCYSPSTLSEIDRDTLVIGSDCNYLRVPLMGQSIEWEMDASSKCNAQIRIVVSADLKPDIPVVVPNPSSGIIKLYFNGNINSFKKVYFYNCIGQKSFEYQGNDYEFDISNLNNDLYYVSIEQNNVIYHTSFVKE